MVNSFGDLCVFLDNSEPSIDGNNVRFTAHSGGTAIHVAMSRHEARKMAEKVNRLLDEAERHEQSCLRFFRKS